MPTALGSSHCRSSALTPAWLGSSRFDKAHMAGRESRSAGHRPKIRCIYTYMRRRRRDDLGKCAGCACFAVRRAARVVTQHYDRSLRPSGLRATQFTVLTMLTLGGPLPLSRVADRLGMERTTLTRNLRPLLAQGLVMIGHSDDRRVRTITITAKGHHAAVAALPHWRRAQRAVARHLTANVFASLDAVTQSLPTSRTGVRGTHRSQVKEMRK